MADADSAAFGGALQRQRALCGAVAERPLITDVNEMMIEKYGVSAHPRCICKACLKMQ